MKIKNNEFEIIIDNSIGLMKIKCTYIEYEKFHFKHINILKIDEICNLFLHSNKININTNKENFNYQFDSEGLAENTFKILSNKYIKYYNITINGTDVKNIFSREIKEDQK